MILLGAGPQTNDVSTRKQECKKWINAVSNFPTIELGKATGGEIGHRFLRRSNLPTYGGEIRDRFRNGGEIRDRLLERSPIYPSVV